MNSDGDNPKAPTKSNLKRKPSPPESESDGEIKFNYISSDEEEPAEDLTHLPSEHIYMKDGVVVADYRRLFSISAEGHKAAQNRKEELGAFYPPEHPTSESAKLRYEHNEKFMKRMTSLAWNGSESSERCKKYAENKKQCDIDAIRAKFNRKSSNNRTDELGCSSKHRLCKKPKTSAHAFQENPDLNDKSDDSETNSVPEEPKI